MAIGEVERVPILTTRLGLQVQAVGPIDPVGQRHIEVDVRRR